MSTTLVEELEQAAYAVENALICNDADWALAIVSRLRARAARVREEEREHVNRSHDARLTLMRLAGPDLGPTRRDGGT